jgi:hypothetical protein
MTGENDGDAKRTRKEWTMKERRTAKGLAANAELQRMSLRHYRR